MEQQKQETYPEYLLVRLAKAAKTLTSEQIEACAFVMGGDRCGWTSENIVKALLHYAQRH